MKNVVIIDEGEWRTRNITLVCTVLLGVVIGYFLAMVYPVTPKSAQPIPPATAMEKWTALALQQAKVGDFAITKDGRALRLSESLQRKVVDGGQVYYNTRMTLGGHLKKPLWEMARDTVAVVNTTHSEYIDIDRCFNNGKRVTTVGPAKWTCT